MKIKTGRGVLVALLVAVVAVVGLGVGAFAVLGDDESHERGNCGGASHEFTVEPEDDGLEASFELQASEVGEQWDITLAHNGTSLVDGQRQTDEDAELDVDADGPDTDGADEFVVTFGRSGSDDECSVTINHD